MSIHEACLALALQVDKIQALHMFNVCCKLRAPAGEDCVFHVLSSKASVALRPQQCLLLWAVHQLVVQGRQPLDFLSRLLPTKHKSKCWSGLGLDILLALARNYVQNVLSRAELGSARWCGVNIALDQE
eukprot:gene1333-1676_t